MEARGGTASRRGGCGIACGWGCGCAKRGTRSRRRSGGAWRRVCRSRRSSPPRVPVWGMSWFFDTENWAVGHLELVGRVAHRRVARGDGPGRHPRRRERRRRRTFAVTPPGVRAATSLHRHRRHRRRRRVAARAARSAPDRRRPRRRAIRRHLVGRRVPQRLDDRLRSEVLAALQGRREAGVRHSRQSRLVRRARGVPRDVSRARRRARRHASARRGRPAADEHDERAHRRPDRRSRSGCARSTRSRPAFSAGRSSRSRPIASRSSPSTPASSSGSTRAQWAWLEAALAARARQAHDGRSWAIRSTRADSIRRADNEDVRASQAPAPGSRRRRS